jgi:hypothetical protein
MIHPSNPHKAVNQWAYDELISRGYALLSDQPEIIQITPWSYVARFKTSHEYIYLKNTPKKIALEASIIHILHDQWSAPVPTMIAHNESLNSFVMKDVGSTVRSILKQHFDSALVIQYVDQFASLQLSIVDKIDVLMNIGVPDWRLEKMPLLYKDIISNDVMLLAEGLSHQKIRELLDLYSIISNHCDTLSTFKIKPSLVQPDFNDNNTLIDPKSGVITFIDLGEIAISHPFFSMMNCLHIIKKQYGLTDQCEAYLQIKMAYLKKFLQVESEKNLLSAFEAAQKLWYVYAILASYRLIEACGYENLKAHGHGKLELLINELCVVF